MPSIRKIISVILFCFVFDTQGYAKDRVSIHDAWVPEAPPVVKTMAGYLVVKNPTDKEVSIIKVSSPDFRTVEMHKSIIKEGMARMIKQDKVVIRAKSQVEFKSGGLHLMLIGAKRRLKAGNEIPLTFEFDNGKKFSTKAIVKPASADTMDHSHHHH